MILFFQAERFVDRQLNDAERLLKNKQKKAKKWYTNFIGDESGVKVNDFHIFVCSFAAGVFVGFASA